MVAQQFQVISTPLNRFFWDGANDGRLLIARCRRCLRYSHPSTGICPTCLGDLSPEPVSGRGTIYSFTVIHHVFHPAFADEVPYIVLLVDLVEQVDLRIISRLVGSGLDEVRIGREVEVTFVSHGEQSVPCFVLADRPMQIRTPE